MTSSIPTRFKTLLKSALTAAVPLGTLAASAQSGKTEVL